jgi:hypothetical protein
MIMPHGAALKLQCAANPRLASTDRKTADFSTIDTLNIDKLAVFDIEVPPVLPDLNPWFIAVGKT